MTPRSRVATASFALVLLGSTTAAAQTRHRAYEFYTLPDTANAMLTGPGEAPAPPAVTSADVGTRESAAVAPVRTIATVVRRAEASRGAQSPTDQNRARAAFERGVQLANGLQWSEAADAFEESYRLVPRPTTLQNLALAHRALGRYTRAIDELQRFLTDGNPPSEARAEVERVINEMRGQLAHLTINPSVQSATITLDDQPVRAGQDMPADPGNHVIVVTAQGYNRSAQNLSLGRGETRTLAVNLEHPSGGVPVPLIVVGAVVIAAGIAVAILIPTVFSHEAMPDCGTLNQCIVAR